MSELTFEVRGVEAERYAAAPTLNVGLRIGEHTGERVHAVALHAQIRIDAQRRRYDEDEQAGARALARKSLRGSRSKDKEARIRRALGVLARKGYPGGLSYRIVREELEQEDVAGDPDQSGL